MNPNYKLVERRDIPEIKSVGHMYVHASGAQVMHIENDDDNKVFNVTFRTPPYDSTGLPHILEHCVLNGSEKYPLKDPFGSLMKGSLVTFLNAMTAYDKTMYPVASCNDKDFMNLMGVYLDSVYRPLIHNREQAFLQEGWHYDLESPDGELKINGVVYNEMKGAMSDPYSVLYEKLKGAVYPDSHYRFNSGGDPSVIPTLTYDNFRVFHKTLYHPANSFILLYGDMNIERCFALLDEYLLTAGGEPEGLKDWVNKPVQKPVEGPVFENGVYPIAAEDNPEGKNYLGACYVLKEFADPFLHISLEALQKILMKTTASPLKNALLENGLGASVESSYDDHAIQPFIVFMAKNSGKDAAAFKAAIDETLNGIVKNGLDRKFVDSCLNSMEFSYREKDYSVSKGLMYLMMHMQGWIYGVNPFDYLSPVEQIGKIRERLCTDERYFENLIKEYLLDNTFSAFVTLTAKPGMQAEKDAELAASLKALKESLGTAEIDSIISKKKALTEAQNTPDSKEVMATIPIVGLEDIRKDARETLLSDDRGLLRADVDTDGVLYNNLLFNAGNLTRDEIPVVGLLLRLFSRLDTKKRSYADLTSEINTHLGGVDMSFNVYGQFGDTEAYTALTGVSSKALASKSAELYAIITEILTETLFDDKARIRMLLTEAKSHLDSGFVNAGNYYGSMRAKSYLGDKHALNDLVHGYGQYEYIKSVLDDYDASFDALRDSLQKVSRKLYDGGGMKVALACPETIYADVVGRISHLREALPGSGGTAAAGFVSANKNEAFIVESKVYYDVVANDFLAKGYAYSGAMRVLQNVLNEGFLLQEIRVKGGAYGYGAEFNRNGCFSAFSYRDPNLARTYETYRNMRGFVENFKPDEREMLQYVLGAVNKLDRPKTARAKLGDAINLHFSGISKELLQAERDALLSADAAKIRDMAGMLGDLMNDAFICTFGGETRINESKDMFDRIVRI